MVSDNRAPGYQEVNSCPKSSTAKDLTIRKFLSGVKKVGNTTVESLERSYTRGTGRHVHYGKSTQKRTGTATKNDKSKHTIALRPSPKTSNAMNNINGAVRIKQEIVNEGLEQQERQNLLREQTTRGDSDMIDLFDDADSIEMEEPYEGTEDYESNRTKHSSATRTSNVPDRMQEEQNKGDDLSPRTENSCIEEQKLLTQYDDQTIDPVPPVSDIDKAQGVKELQGETSPFTMGSGTNSSFNANRRPWVSAGSRKKPKNYFSDIKALQDKMGNLITDVDTNDTEPKLDGDFPPPVSYEESNDLPNDTIQESLGPKEIEASTSSKKNGDRSTNEFPVPTNSGPTEGSLCIDKLPEATTTLPATDNMDDILTSISNDNAVVGPPRSRTNLTHTGSNNNRDGGQRKKVSFRASGSFNAVRTGSGFHVIAKSQPSAKEQLAHRGRNLIEEERFLVTSIKVEFNLASTVTEYNIREQFLNLLVLFRRHDRKLRVKASTGEHKEWSDFTQLPEDSEFNHSFQLVTREFRNHKKVILHCKLITEKPLNKIKYAEEVKTYIFSHNIWLKADRYDSKAEGSPGFFAMLHPKMINRVAYTGKLTSILTQIVQASDGEAITDKKFPEAETSLPTGGQLTVPPFHLEVSQKKWGKIKVDVLRVNCALDDADALKQLLVIASEQNTSQHGLFIPVGIHLMTGPDTLTQILQDHATFLGDVRGIPITGISPVQMNSTLANGSATLQDSITGLDGVLSVEQTRDTQHMGKWLILTTSAKEATVLETVTGLLKNLTPAAQSQGFLTVGKQFVRPHASKMNRVHSYAEALTQKFPATASGHPTKHSQEAGPLPKESTPQTVRPALPKTSPTNLAQVGHDLKLAEAMFQKRLRDMERQWQEVEVRIQKNRQSKTPHWRHN